MLVTSIVTDWFLEPNLRFISQERYMAVSAVSAFLLGSGMLLLGYRAALKNAFSHPRAPTNARRAFRDVESN